MLLFILLWMHLVIISSCVSNNPGAKSFKEKMQNVPMKTEEGLQMVQHWMDQAIGVFMAAVANKRLKTQPKHVIDEFGVCSNKAQTIPMQAKCVSRLLKDQITGRKFLKKKKTVWPSSTRLRKYNSKKAIHMSERRSGKKSWIGGLHVKKYTDQNYRAKRNVVSTRKDYQLKSPNDGRMTPLGSVAHMLMKAVLASKNKTQTKPWQETVQRIRDSNTKRKLIKKRLEEESIENMEQFAFRGMKSRGMVGEDLNEIIEDPKRLKDFLTKKRSQKSKEPSTRLMNLLREGFKLGYTISGKNASKFDDKNLKIASPRFLSVVPENEDNKDNELDFLSPSLFSLHNQGKGLENLTSLPSLVKGFSSKDQQAWLDLIMEAAGVVEEAEKIEEKFSDKNVKSKDFVTRYKKESVGKDGTPLYFTKENVTEMYGNFEERKIDLFEKLCQNFSKDQVKEMNKTGFAMLSPKQLEMLYGSESPYNNSKALKQFSQLNNSVIHQHIEDEVSRTAEMKSFKIRLKQIVLSPVSFTVIGPSSQVPVILSPVIFSPAILAPSVLGPFILSPLLFVPVILSPRALGPLILSPLAFVPFILSPVVLHPVILSPGIFVPIILTPIALSPFILSPQVFTPLILSPFVLTPFILNPAAASPIILSPFALSPIIYSPQFFSALILSPYVLSPIIISPLVAYTVLLSPSYLS